MTDNNENKRSKLEINHNQICLMIVFIAISVFLCFHMNHRQNGPLAYNQTGGINHGPSLFPSNLPGKIFAYVFEPFLLILSVIASYLFFLKAVFYPFKRK